MFSTVGDVESAEVKVSEGRNGNYYAGYVRMATEQQALDSIDRFNGLKLDGNVLVVMIDAPHVPRPGFSAKKAVAAAKAAPKPPR